MEPLRAPFTAAPSGRATKPLEHAAHKGGGGSPRPGRPTPIRKRRKSCETESLVNRAQAVASREAKNDKSLQPRRGGVDVVDRTRPSPPSTTTSTSRPRGCRRASVAASRDTTACARSPSGSVRRTSSACGSASAGQAVATRASVADYVLSGFVGLRRRGGDRRARGRRRRVPRRGGPRGDTAPLQLSPEGLTALQGHADCPCHSPSRSPPAALLVRRHPLLLRRSRGTGEPRQSARPYRTRRFVAQRGRGRGRTVRGARRTTSRRSSRSREPAGGQRSPNAGSNRAPEPRRRQARRAPSRDGAMRRPANRGAVSNRGRRASARRHTAARHVGSVAMSALSSQMRHASGTGELCRAHSRYEAGTHP